jgi:hypothetical protein
LERPLQEGACTPRQVARVEGTLDLTLEAALLEELLLREELEKAAFGANKDSVVGGMLELLLDELDEELGLPVLQG